MAEPASASGRGSGADPGTGSRTGSGNALDTESDADTPFEHVEVVYALPQTQEIVSIAYEPSMTVGDAVGRSGLADRFPDVLARPLAIGRHGVVVADAEPVAPGDRLEILRPLRIDPRQMRVDLVSAGMVMGRRDGSDTGED